MSVGYVNTRDDHNSIVSLIFAFSIIRTLDYPDSRLSGLFTLVPPSPDNRGSTVVEKRTLVVKKAKSEI